MSGPTVSQGYWNRPEETERTFRAYLADTGEGPFFRTGDLGFLKDGELFVTGRLKDLIIIGGRNLYPTRYRIDGGTESSGNTVRLLRGVFGRCRRRRTTDRRCRSRARVPSGPRSDNAPDNGGAAAHPKGWLPLDVDAVVRAIRRAVAEEHDVRVHAVVLLRAGRIPKTPSGKVQRHACQASFLNGTLATLDG